jgi:hypothetical protein
VTHDVALYCAEAAHLRQGEATPRRAEVALVRVHDDRLEEVVVPRAVQAFLGYVRQGDHLEPLVGAAPRRRDLAEQVVREGADLRGRWRFECPLCGMTVPARSDRLALVLHKLRAAGVSELSLRGLASTLT